MSEIYDAIIIGSGAGGGTIAQELANAGKKILILERGPYLKRENDNFDARKVFIKRIYRTQEKWLDKNNREFHPNTNYFVGGNTSFYGAALMRMKPKDFEELNHYGGEKSPAWPISYNEMSPWYEKAEKLWKVHGKRGEDPTDDNNAPEFPFKSIKHDEEITPLLNHFRTKGMTPSSLPLGIDFEPANDGLTPSLNGKCIRCATCAGHPCIHLAKSDARAIALAPIITKPNVTLLDNCKVEKLICAQNGGKIIAVECNLNGEKIEFKADIFILSAGAVNSAVLLLKSQCAGHENGIANASNLVGKNYMFHTTSAFTSIMAHEVKAKFPKTFAIMDYYFKDIDGGFDYPMGQIQSLPAMTGPYVEGQISHIYPHFLFPNFLSDMIAKRMVSFMVMSEDLPKTTNKVSIKNDGRICLDYTPNNLEGHKRLIKKLREALKGYSLLNREMYEPHFEIDQMIPLLGTAHQCGTIKFGNNPNESVLDINCKAHGIDNLYVCDSSFFPSSSAVNPALTIIANSLRVGAHIIERLK